MEKVANNSDRENHDPLGLELNTLPKLSPDNREEITKATLIGTRLALKALEQLQIKPEVNN